MNGLDLFSGLGGISLALEPWINTIAYCENDPYACGVLLSRMANGQLQHAPIWDDVTTLRGEHFKGQPVDFVSGGFPCQDLSVAGTGRGLDGERSGLYREVIRLVRELRPSFVFLENVPNIRTKGADVVTGDLAGLGYDCRWTTLSASEVGAPHKRNRWWLLARRRQLSFADATSFGRNTRKIEGIAETNERRESGGSTSDANRIELRIQPEREQFQPSKRGNEIVGDASQTRGGSQTVANSNGSGLAIDGARIDHNGSEPLGNDANGCDARNYWQATRPPFPAIRRVDDGARNRLDRLRVLGNAVVWQQARAAFELLAGLRH